MAADTPTKPPTTLGLTGLTSNAMALIAPGAFLWLTFFIQASYGQPLAAMGMWTSGDSAKSNPFKTIGYFQPLDTDTSYLADWGTQILSLGIDYFHILYNNAGGLNPGVAIGYDKYGRKQVGAKVAYAVTPAFTVGAGEVIADDRSTPNCAVAARAFGTVTNFLLSRILLPRLQSQFGPLQG